MEKPTNVTKETNNILGTGIVRIGLYDGVIISSAIIALVLVGLEKLHIIKGDSRD